MDDLWALSNNPCGFMFDSAFSISWGWLVGFGKQITKEKWEKKWECLMDI